MPSDVNMQSTAAESTAQQQEETSSQGVGKADSDGKDGHSGAADVVSTQLADKQKVSFCFQSIFRYL